MLLLSGNALQMVSGGTTRRWLWRLL